LRQQRTAANGALRCSFDEDRALEKITRVCASRCLPPETGFKSLALVPHRASLYCSRESGRGLDKAIASVRKNKKRHWEETCSDFAHHR